MGERKGETGTFHERDTTRDSNKNRDKDTLETIVSCPNSLQQNSIPIKILHFE